MIDGNTFISQQGTAQTAINLGNTEYVPGAATCTNGDTLDRAPVASNNRACYPVARNRNSRVVQLFGPVATTPVDPSNMAVTSSTGDCAR